MPEKREPEPEKTRDEIDKENRHIPTPTCKEAKTDRCVHIVY